MRNRCATSSTKRITPRVAPVAGDEEQEWCVEAEALVRTVRGRVEELLPLKNLPPEILSVTTNVNEAGRLAASDEEQIRKLMGSLSSKPNGSS